MHLMDVAMNRDDEPSGQTGDSRTRQAMAGVSSSNPDVAGRWVRASRPICIMQLFRGDGSMLPCCGNWSVMSAAKCETGHNGRRETSLRKMVLAAPTD